MKKTISSLIALLVGVATASAQPDSWNYVGDNAYGYSHVVYAGLVNSSGKALTTADINGYWGYWLGAFIGDECRGVAQVEQYPSQGDPEFMYFTMRIRGEAADNGKAVTFRLMTSSTQGFEYIISGSQSLTYSNEGTTGQPSSLFALTFQQPLSFTLPENIEVKVGESVDLKSLITFSPSDASVPVSLGDWDFSNSNEYINVTNDKLNGLKPTDNAYLGMSQMWQTVQSTNGNYWTTVKVIQPATGISINSEYADGDTVYVGDSQTLTTILNSCYTLTPADANEQVAWTWSPEGGITIGTDDNGGKSYNPNTAGIYRLEAKVGNHSATMPLTVLNHVNSITAVTDTIHLFVGDNLSELMPHTVAIKPSQYVNTKLEYGVKNDATEVVQELNGVWRAVAEGKATLVVTSPDIPNSPAIIPIVVHPNVTDVEIYNKTLTYEYQSGDTTHITRDVMNNFTLTPGKDYTLQKGELTTSNNKVCGIEYHSGTWCVYTDTLGSSTLTVTHSTKHTTLLDGGLTTDTVIAIGSFVVRVVQGLSGFAFDKVVMGRNDSHALTLVPEPRDAEIDGSQITVQVIADNLPQNWTLATVKPQTGDTSGLNWSITPKAIGTGMIVVSYNGQIISRQSITIGQSFVQKEGWAWVTPYGGSVESIEALYGDNLQEMRSQAKVMYNDPKYGYFGALSTMPTGQSYKVKIKEGRNVETFNNHVDYSNEATSISVGDKWNWIGFPYQFDHAITDVLKGSAGAAAAFAAGDRIVSKDDGFTEYDGESWDGDLTVLKAGEGYMFYNASGSQKAISFQSEANLGQPSAGSSNAKAYIAKAHRAKVWQYNSSKFADNMTIVADLGTEYASSSYSVGAFIGDECRGEGSFVNGKWFITVHGDAKDQDNPVSFKVYDTMTGSTRLVDGSQPYSAKAGSLRSPLCMRVSEITDIDKITVDADNLSGVEIYTIDGQRVSGKPGKGIYIVRQNGKARKIVVK